MRQKYLSQQFFSEPNDSLKKAVRKIDQNGYGLILVVNQHKKLLGLITAGDIRKIIQKGGSLNSPVSKWMNQKPIVISAKEANKPEEVQFKYLKRKIELLNQRISEPIELITIPIVNEKKIVKEIAVYSLKRKRVFLISKKRLNLGNDVKKVLVVGGAGYLGSVLSAQLLAKGYQVRVLDKLLFGKESLKNCFPNPNFELIKGDVRHINTINRAIEGVDAVIHLAAIVGDPASQKYPKETIEINYLSSVALALACKYHQINRFIFASTCSVYGINESLITEETPLNPVSLYARTKIESEKGILQIRDKNFTPLVFRMATLYGLSPRMRFDLVVNTFTKMAVTQGKISIFGGNQWRPFLQVDDAARVYLACLKEPLQKLRALKKPIINIGTDKQNYSIAELGNTVKKILPQTKIEISRPKFGEEGVDQRSYKVSFSKLKQLFNIELRGTIEKSIIDIQNAIKKKVIKNPENRKYYN